MHGFAAYIVEEWEAFRPVECDSFAGREVQNP